jgi:hypothetical protein
MRDVLCFAMSQQVHDTINISVPTYSGDEWAGRKMGIMHDSMFAVAGCPMSRFIRETWENAASNQKKSPESILCDIQPCARSKFIPSLPGRGNNKIERSRKFLYNSLVFYILISKLFAMRILQADPRLSPMFSRSGTGGRVP